MLHQSVFVLELSWPVCLPTGGENHEKAAFILFSRPCRVSQKRRLGHLFVYLLVVAPYFYHYQLEVTVFENVKKLFQKRSKLSAGAGSRWYFVTLRIEGYSIIAELVTPRLPENETEAYSVTDNGYLLSCFISAPNELTATMKAIQKVKPWIRRKSIDSYIEMVEEKKERHLKVVV